MAKLDLEDLPDAAAATLAGLQPGEALELLKGGAVVARLSVGSPAEAPPAAPLPEASMEEVMEQFEAMIHDQF